MIKGLNKNAIQLAAHLCTSSLFAFTVFVGFSESAVAMNKHTCQILISSQGQLGTRFDGKVLGSREPGGLSGYADVSATNSSYRIALDGPYGFSQSPNGGGDNVIYSSSFSGYGATNFAETPGTISVKLKRGNSRITVDAKAEKTSNVFPAGYYGMQVTLRCE